MSIKIVRMKEIISDEKYHEKRFVSFDDHVKALREQRDTLKINPQVEEWRLKCRMDFVKYIDAVSLMYTHLLYSTNLLEDTHVELRGTMLGIQSRDRVSMNLKVLGYAVEAGNDT